MFSPTAFAFQPSHARALRKTRIHGESSPSPGGCQDICPEDCIEILLSERVTHLPVAARELAPILADGARGGSVFIKDEETCIRCGLCAARCPVGTITMQSFHTPEGAHV